MAASGARPSAMADARDLLGHARRRLPLVRLVVASKLPRRWLRGVVYHFFAASLRRISFLVIEIDSTQCVACRRPMSVTSSGSTCFDTFQPRACFGACWPIVFEQSKPKRIIRIDRRGRTDRKPSLNHFLTSNLATHLPNQCSAADSVIVDRVGLRLRIATQKNNPPGRLTKTNPRPANRPRQSPKEASFRESASRPFTVLGDDWCGFLFSSKADGRSVFQQAEIVAAAISRTTESTHATRREPWI